MKIKEYNFRTGEKVAFEYDEYGVGKITLEGMDLLMSMIESRPKGEWIYCEDDEGQDGYRCSECGFFVPWYYDYEDSNYILDYKACPHCLAKMKGAEDERKDIQSTDE